jgi:EAL domain-containing protein (putative c-di-GMP-specific phosphodiesterase class I)
LAYNPQDEARVIMTIEEMVLKRLRRLPPEKQKEVLQFVESLNPDNGSKKPLRSLEGLLEDLNVDITGEDIAEARREMWGNFL